MMSGVGGMYPSLHLDLADVYRRLNRPDDARRHVDAGMSRIESLGNDGYGNLIRSGLERVAARLEQDPVT